MFEINHKLSLITNSTPKLTDDNKKHIYKMWNQKLKRKKEMIEMNHKLSSIPKTKICGPRKPPKKLTDPDKKRIYRMWKTTYKPFPRIAKEFGISCQYAQKIVAKIEGCTSKDLKKIRLNRRKNEICKIWRTGSASLQDIARHFGLSACTISKTLEDNYGSYIQAENAKNLATNENSVETQMSCGDANNTTKMFQMLLDMPIDDSNDLIGKYFDATKDSCERAFSKNGSLMYRPTNPEWKTVGE